MSQRKGTGLEQRWNWELRSRCVSIEIKNIFFTRTNYSMIEYFPLSSQTLKSTEKMEGWWLLWCLWESSSCGTGLWNLWASWDMRYHPKFHVGVGTNQGKSQKKRGTMRDRNTQQMRHIYFYGHVLEETREWISDFPMLVGTDFGAKKYQAMSTFVRSQKGSERSPGIAESWGVMAPKLRC